MTPMPPKAKNKTMIIPADMPMPFRNEDPYKCEDT